jgi:hypothetical protein
MNYFFKLNLKLFIIFIIYYKKNCDMNSEIIQSV